MDIAKVYINEVSAQTVYAKDITKGMKGGKITLDYSGSLWAGLVKNVAFTNGLQTVGIKNAGMEVEIPPEVTAVAGVEILMGVCGIDGKGVVIPTLWASLGDVKDGAPSDFEEADQELTPSVVEQILSLIGPMDELGTETKDSLVAAINEIIRLAGGEVDPEAIAAAVEEYLAANPVKVTETDPTVPDWAKQPTKPSYTAAEVGAQAPPLIVTFSESAGASHTLEEIVTAFDEGRNITLLVDGKYPYELKEITTECAVFRQIGIGSSKVQESVWSIYADGCEYGITKYNPTITHPVTSVNGKTGAVILTASDVGALPSSTVIPTVPTKVSAFTNDAGYLTEVPEGYAKSSEIPTDDHINQLINTALGVIENGTY